MDSEVFVVRASGAGCVASRRGRGSFENDDAADWDLAFRHAELAAGLQLITDARLAAGLAGPASEVDGSIGERAVAAAELVTAINGQPIDELPATGARGSGSAELILILTGLLQRQDPEGEDPATDVTKVDARAAGATSAGRQPAPIKAVRRSPHAHGCVPRFQRIARCR